MRIAFIGPESSGKTTLSEILAQKYTAELITEYSRVYLAEIQTNYSYEDLEFIAKGQFNCIINSKENNLVIIDTDLISMQVWSEFKYNKCCDFIKENIFTQQIDIYFLCKPDFPWIEDNLRENPNDREVLFDLFIKILKEYKIDYKILEGSITNRFQLCETNINSYLNNEKS